MTPTREELIDICRRGIVQQKDWHDRDSASAQKQLAVAGALLAAGCDFTVCYGDGTGCHTDDRTIWIEVRSKGFAALDYGGNDDEDTFYLPTAGRLAERAGRDWY